jgi:hypothetical protein
MYIHIKVASTMHKNNKKRMARKIFNSLILADKMTDHQKEKNPF